MCMKHKVSSHRGRGTFATEAVADLRLDRVASVQVHG